MEGVPSYGSNFVLSGLRLPITEIVPAHGQNGRLAVGLPPDSLESAGLDSARTCQLLHASLSSLRSRSSPFLRP
jgi:hypothetical protein